MLNLISVKKLYQWGLVLVALLVGGPVLADETGQIININQNYQIAFTDLGNRTLNSGDIVKVSLSADDFIYMQVIESSAILSKLGPSKIEGFGTNLNSFGHLAVGDLVVKVTAGRDLPVNLAGAENSSKEKEDTAAQLQIQKLEQELALAKDQIKLLQESNEKSKATLNELIKESQIKKEEAVVKPADHSKETLAQIGTHLENMHKLINDND